MDQDHIDQNNMKQDLHACKRRPFQHLSEQVHCLRQKCTAAVVGFVLSGTIVVQAQYFLPPVQDPFGLFPVNSILGVPPILVDLDQDGDLDVFGSSYGSNGVPSFYENNGSADSAAFGPGQVNPFGLNSEMSWPTVADLDNDGDIDVLETDLDHSTNQTVFYYYENIGTANTPVYAPVAQVNPFGLISPAATYIAGQLADMDGDSDVDYLGVYKFTGVFYYYENTGTACNPMFSAPIAAPFSLASLPSPLNYNCAIAVGDMDLDADLDVIVGGTSGGAFLYYENTGSPASPTFAPPQMNPFGLTPLAGFVFPAMGDLDNDGDVDLLTNGFTGSVSFYFYENTDSTVVLEEQESEVKVYPTPFGQDVRMEFGKTISGQVRVYDLTERCVHRKAFSLTDQISLDLAGLTAGPYLIELQTASGSKIIRITKQ